MRVKIKIHPVVILLLGLLFLVPQNLYSEETDFKYFKNYSYKDYDHQPQNWRLWGQVIYFSAKRFLT